MKSLAKTTSCLQEQTSVCLNTALRALKAGICVVPPRNDGTKAPLGEWKKWQNERPTERQIRVWYRRGLTGVGFVTGAVSGHLELLEFETEETWHAFKETARNLGLGDLLERIEEGYCERTPGGGIHLLYRCEPAKPNTKLAQRVVTDPETGKEKREVLIETRGEGGYVIVAPSCGAVHPSGKPYVLLRGGVETIARITPEERDQLWNLARTFDEVPLEAHVVYTPQKPLPPHANRPGDDFNRRVTWEELLPRYGWTLVHKRDGVGYWRRPGKEGRGCSATTNYAASDLLYVFSTSTALEANRAYSKFSFYAIVEHGGDFEAAARALAAQGYGDRDPEGNGQEPEGEKERLSQADILIRLGTRAILFHAEDEEPYAVVEANGHREIWPVRGQGFRRWLVREFYEATGKAPNSDSLNQALNVLEAKAVIDGETHRLSLRVAEHEGAFWYDLADPGWRACKITPAGWELVDKPPILFRRYKITAAQVEPRRGGDLRDFLKLVNVKGENDRLLLLVYLVTLLVPEIPKPILAVYGEKGAGKSTLLRMIRMLVDPAVEPLLVLRGDERELAILLAHNYAPFFDNVSGLSQWQSDALCRATTGAGFTTRALYTDEEERIFRLKRAVGLSGIHLVAGGTDLQDRFLSIELERIGKEARQQEVDIMAEFERLRPHLFGAMLDALAVAMRIKSQLHFTELPRMADFAAWGAAVAEALGIGANRFLAAYWQNIGQVNERLLESHPVAAAVVALLRDTPEWRATPGELLEKLEEVAAAEKINIKARSWPKSAAALTRRLKELASNLADAGIRLEAGKDTAGIRGRFILLQKIEENIVASVASVESQKNQGFPCDDTCDDIEAPSSISSQAPLLVCDDIRDPQKIASQKSSQQKPSSHAGFDDSDDSDDIFTKLLEEDTSRRHGGVRTVRLTKNASPASPHSPKEPAKPELTRTQAGDACGDGSGDAAEERVKTRHPRKPGVTREGDAGDAGDDNATLLLEETTLFLSDAEVAFSDARIQNDDTSSTLHKQRDCGRSSDAADASDAKFPQLFHDGDNEIIEGWI